MLILQGIFKRVGTSGNGEKLENGGDGGIRTLGTGLNQYNGLANRRLKPLGHVSVRWTYNIEVSGKIKAP